MSIQIGDKVKVTSLAGIEFGTIASVNSKTQKADVFFNYNACPHFDRFNFNQIEKVGA